ncbi:DUF4164 family protein [Phenylobacterium immobile]|uniref:DUF4164 family protein n=1 Tax=Phenylobacterium immobile TaxID=21 RepID=UPI000AE99B83|nr:DUF4164 family protein [Phenylobacterium immobile]
MRCRRGQPRSDLRNRADAGLRWRQSFSATPIARAGGRALTTANTPPTLSPASESALEIAAKRLERAVLGLEQRLTHRVGEARAEAGGLFDFDRNRLAAELDQSRAREKELEAAGAEASAALSRAMDEIRAALANDEGKSE